MRCYGNLVSANNHVDSPLMNANLTLYLPQVLLTWRPNPAGQFLDVSNPAGQFLDVFKHCGAVFGRFPTLRFSSWAFLTRGKFLDVPNPARRFFDVSSFKTIISRKLSDSVKILVFKKKKLFQIIWNVEKIDFREGSKFPNLRMGVWPVRCTGPRTANLQWHYYICVIQTSCIGIIQNWKFVEFQESDK